MLERLPLPSRLGLAAFLGSAALLGGAYYFQYVEGMSPCEMCLWQRYPHMVAIAAGLLAVVSLAFPRLAMIFALIAILALFVTSGIGIFHYGVEQHMWQGPRACTGVIPSGLSPEQLKKLLLSTQMVRCDVPAWQLGHISMAGWNAILSGGLAILLAGKIIQHARGSLSGLQC
jgi:disulfide bond formation protein DsbB